MNEKKNEIAKKEITSQVLEKIKTFEATGELKIPADYSPENAIKSAYLVLLETKNAAKKNALEACSQTSIANALLKMVVSGLSPLKKQCAFIMYGDKLECQTEYAGNIALAKRWGNMADIKASAVFEGDIFEYHTDAETGRKVIDKHESNLANQEAQKVIGAFAVVTMENGDTFAEVMAMAQIRAAWGQGATKGNSPAHKNFPDQMAIKTVISRACKLLVRGSSDSILYDDHEPKGSPIDDQVAHEIKTEANKQELDFEQAVEVVDEAEEIQEEKTESAIKPEPNF